MRKFVIFFKKNIYFLLVLLFVGELQWDERDYFSIMHFPILCYTLVELAKHHKIWKKHVGMRWWGWKQEKEINDVNELSFSRRLIISSCLIIIVYPFVKEKSVPHLFVMNEW